MKIGMVGPRPYQEGTALSFLILATRGLSLFCNRKPEMAILGLKGGQTKKIRPLCLCK